MAIQRKDFEAGRVDLSDVATGKRLKPTHPGDVLKHEFLEPMGLSAYRLAHDIDVPLTRVTGILARQRAVTADTAMRLGRYFGTSAALWLGLQMDFDLEIAERKTGRDIRQRVKPRAKHAA